VWQGNSWPKVIRRFTRLKAVGGNGKQPTFLLKRNNARRYLAELDSHPEALNELIKVVRRGTVTLLFAAKKQEFNNAVALKEYLEQKFKV